MSERKIGLAIKRRRKELGLSQSELASRLGYKDHSTLAKVETGGERHHRRYAFQIRQSA